MPVFLDYLTADHLILSKRKKKTNVLVCVTFMLKRQLLKGILDKRCSFLLAEIYIFIDFIVLEKSKNKSCRTDSCRSSVFKRSRYAVSTSIANNTLQEKLTSDPNTISDLIRDERYVDFYWIGKYFEDSALAECSKL